MAVCLGQKFLLRPQQVAKYGWEETFAMLWPAGDVDCEGTNEKFIDPMHIVLISNWRPFELDRNSSMLCISIEDEPCEQQLLWKKCCWGVDGSFRKDCTGRNCTHQRVWPIYLWFIALSPRLSLARKSSEETQKMILCTITIMTAVETKYVVVVVVSVVPSSFWKVKKKEDISQYSFWAIHETCMWPYIRAKAMV